MLEPSHLECGNNKTTNDNNEANNFQPGDLAGTSKHCKHTDIMAFREPSKLAGKSHDLQQTGSAQFACPQYNTNSKNNTDANFNSTEIRKNAKNPTNNAANTSANTTNTKNAKETNNFNNTNTC